MSTGPVESVESGLPELKPSLALAAAGAGVLALPRSLGWMGWVAGPLAIIAFYVVSLLCSW